MGELGRCRVGARVLVVALIAIGVVSNPVGAGALSCTTGPRPTVRYVGTVVIQLDDVGVTKRYVMDVGGRAITVSVVREISGGYTGPLPKVGHRYDITGFPTEIKGREAVSLSPCSKSLVVELGGPERSGRDGRELAAGAGVLLAAAVAGLVGFRRHRASAP